jgi:hypothetical protein
MKNITVQLAQYKPLLKWEPQLGDMIICHGWFTHSFGLINAIDGGVLSVVQAGLPVLLLAMDELDFEKNTKKMSTSSIRQSRAGKYAVLQNIANTQIWYI